MTATAHDIVVIGSSSGGISALRTLLGDLPTELDASLFIVQHLSPDSPGLLPEILLKSLRKGSLLNVTEARDGDPIRRGSIAIAPADRHLLLERGCLRVVHGPKENLSRPAINPLFRSAAVAFGSRVMGIILSGSLDDGATGLASIHGRGGLTVVQEPSDALFPSMPLNALKASPIDLRLKLPEIAALIARVARRQTGSESIPAVDAGLQIESEMAKGRSDFHEALDHLGTRTSFTCPECHGSLWELRQQEQVHYRCHIGHSYSERVFQLAQQEAQERALGTALKTIEERLMLYRRMADKLRRDSGAASLNTYDELVMELSTDAAQLRGMLNRASPRLRDAREARDVKDTN